MYFGCNDAEVYALDGATGWVNWAYSTGGPVRSIPALVDGTLYVGSRDGSVYTLRTGTSP